MERKRGSIPSARARKRGKTGNEKVDDIENQELGPSFADLPFPITNDILLRLSTKSVLICKRVCRTWNTLISDPHFKKLHFERSSIGFLIRTCDPKLVSRTMYLLEDEPPELDSECSNSLKLEPTLKLPLRDGKLVLDEQDGTDGFLVCNAEDHRFDVVNSCNGLLCLCQPFNNDPLVVCNPVTGEFIRLPKVIKSSHSQGTLYSGIGFHTKTNEYKVVRILYGRISNVEINVVGTPTWRKVRVDDLPSPPTFFQHNVICMGALRDSLYVCNASLPSSMDVWIMKDDDTGIFWTKAFTWRGCAKFKLPAE
ncbi:hypothetical protein TSUD_214320 [Trifolium subterraneum]|uniref:F-box domain-containing protein n=1 Tax=Trifolium subterraneum TaxID=3900 RepID=A0A2Z6NJX3_TRISU|nr:hypothetical protein TSUD_214320 [Trifolium subterraneum]